MADPLDIGLLSQLVAGGGNRVAQAAGLGASSSGTGLATIAPAAATAAPATPGLMSQLLGKGGAVTKGSMARAAAPAAAGMFASSLVPNVDDTSWDSAGRGALTGGGIGATAGLLGGPLAPLSVPVGTALGAGIGGLIGLFGPKDDAGGANAVAEATKVNTAKFEKVLGQFNLSDQSRVDLQAQLAPLLMNATSREQVDAAFQQAAAVIPQIIAQDQVYKQQEQAVAERTSRAAAMQSLLAPALQQWAKQADIYANEAAGAQRSAADTLQDPTLAAVYRNGAAQIPLQQAQESQRAISQLGLADAAYGQQAQLMRDQQQQATLPSQDDLIAQLLGSR